MEQEFDKSVYSRFIDDMEVSNILLNELFLSNDFEKVLENLELEMETQVAINLDEFKRVDNHGLNLFPAFQVLIVDKETSKELIQCQMKYCIICSVKDLQSYDDIYIKCYLEKNIPYTIWPYVRELMSSLTGRMGISPLILPTLKRL